MNFIKHPIYSFPSQGYSQFPNTNRVLTNRVLKFRYSKPLYPYISSYHSHRNLMCNADLRYIIGAPWWLSPLTAIGTQALIGSLTPAGPVVAMVSVKKLIIAQSCVNGFSFVAGNSLKMVDRVVTRVIPGNRVREVATQTDPTTIFSGLPGPDALYYVIFSVGAHYAFQRYLAPRLLRPEELVLDKLQKGTLSNKEEFLNVMKGVSKEQGNHLIEVPNYLVSTLQQLGQGCLLAIQVSAVTACATCAVMLSIKVLMDNGFFDGRGPKGTPKDQKPPLNNYHPRPFGYQTDDDYPLPQDDPQVKKKDPFIYGS